MYSLSILEINMRCILSYLDKLISKENKRFLEYETFFVSIRSDIKNIFIVRLNNIRFLLKKIDHPSYLSNKHASENLCYLLTSVHNTILNIVFALFQKYRKYGYLPRMSLKKWNVFTERILILLLETEIYINQIFDIVEDEYALNLIKMK